MLKSAKLEPVKDNDGNNNNHTAALRKLALELSMAEARERRRIAEDLHDHLGQHLALIQMKLSTFQGNTMFCGHEQDLVEIQNLLDKAIHYTRHLTMAISPPILYELGLVPALKWLSEQYTRQHKLTIKVIEKSEIPPVEPDIRGILYRSVRELFLNTIKHARAERSDLSIDFENGDVVLSFVDNGTGFDPDTIGHANEFGLFSIRERMAYLGGKLVVDSSPGAGTSIQIHCPVKLESIA